MDHGAILLPVNIAERHPAAPADTVPRTTVRIPIPRVRGASTAIPSTGVQKPAPAAGLCQPQLFLRFMDEGR